MKWVVSVVTNLLPRDLRTVSAHELNQMSLSTKQKAAKPQRHRFSKATYVYTRKPIEYTTQLLASSKAISFFF